MVYPVFYTPKLLIDSTLSDSSQVTPHGFSHGAGTDGAWSLSLAEQIQMGGP